MLTSNMLKLVYRTVNLKIWKDSQRVPVNRLVSTRRRVERSSNSGERGFVLVAYMVCAVVLFGTAGHKNLQLIEANSGNEL
jgi:hypothetical protein